MLPSSGDDLTIPHNLDPLGDDVLATMGGHLNVHLPSVSLKVGQHLRVPVGIADVADFGFLSVHCSVEPVDVAPGFGEALVGDGGASSDCRDEAVCHGPCCVGEVL